MSSRGVCDVAALLVTTRPVPGKSKWLRTRSTSSRWSGRLFGALRGRRSRGGDNHLGSSCSLTYP